MVYSSSSSNYSTATYYYYSSFQDTITSLCKSILPFGFKNRRLTADQRLAKRHSDSLKWQQESFHRILNLIGLQREGIAAEAEVAAFRAQLLETLIVAPPKDQEPEPEPAGVIRDKLLFLQELLYAKCISAEDYHSSKRPLLQRLAVQGVEIDCRDVIVGAPTANSDEEWTDIDLKDKEEPSVAANKSKHRTPPIKAFFTKVNATTTTKGKGNKDTADSTRGGDHNLMHKGTILMPESSPLVPVKPEKGKRKPFGTLFRKEQQEDGNENKNPNLEPEEKGGTAKSSKKPWGLEGFKKWKKNSNVDESTVPYLPSRERSDAFTCELVASPLGEGPDTKRLKKKIHSDGSNSDFFIDKVLGDNIKKELSRIQSELSATNPNLNFSDEQIEAISTKLPTDKSDLGGFFPKAWCDRYGEIVLDVVKKEFKEHVGEMESLRNTAAKEKRNGVAENWVAFEDNEENFHPNLFSQSQPLLNRRLVNDDNNNNNPFYDG
ncbi:uncharacterized protein LOC109718668 [Ananas comosus]|uniref:Uncharacterized protein LOC109718668 n=1 Tax=Ananas comosus TaxID=4615 RepID=A0A6P5G4C9_ANACO|nr:uncharacterized protein LOC109718668 [Ananas comosus]